MYMQTILRNLLILLLASVTLNASAQRKKQRAGRMEEVPHSERILKAYKDSLTQYRLLADSLLAANDSLREANGSKVAQRYFPLFSPITFRHDMAGTLLGTDDSMDIIGGYALMDIYFNRPDLITYSTNRLKASLSAQDTGILKPHERVKMTSHAKDNAKEAAASTKVEAQPIDLYVSKPNFWKFTGDYYLQFMQNHISDNWYKSGSSNYSMLGIVTLEYNYNNKQKVKWDNKLEMRLGFQTSEGDTINRFKTSEDLLRYTSKIGLQAHKRWYYTALLVANTQFTHGKKENKKEVLSDFMSPFNLNLSLGMDYNVETNNKRLTGNIHIAPLAYNFKYVGRLNLAKNFGIDENHHSLNDFGSQVTIDMTWKPLDMLKWQTRLYAYTTYHKLEVEWENTITFQFNKYISTNLFLYPRFDDSVNRDNDKSYFQFKEYLSIGFSYNM